jgi:hypothetical protein
MTKHQRLVEACYRHMINPDFHIDRSGITFSMSPEDLALIRSASWKQLEKAMTVAAKTLTTAQCSTPSFAKPSGKCAAPAMCR